MTTEYYGPKDAPSFARHSSTFKTDSRVEEVDFVVGDSWDEVMEIVKGFFDAYDLTDYDVNWSTEGEKFVGVTCRDIDL